jgi:hypothetical protein
MLKYWLPWNPVSQMAAITAFAGICLKINVNKLPFTYAYQKSSAKLNL